MTRETVVLVTLIAYKIVLITIGFLAERRTRDGEDFFLGGRGLGPWVAAISASASSSSAWTLLSVSGMAYASGLAAIWLFPACVGGFCLNWFVLAPALQSHSRRSGALTTTEVLAGEPGRPGRATVQTLASLIILASLVTYVASQFQGAGKTFAETFREEYRLTETGAILIGAGIVMLYTLLGGFWAVSLTDTLQGLLMAGTSIVLPIAALVAVGGPGELLDRLGPDGLSLTKGLSLVMGLGFILGLLGIGLGYPGQPHVVNRFMALREGQVQNARRIAIGWAVVVYAGMILLGLCGRVLFPVLADKENIFTRATNELFTPVLAGVMIAAVLSAIMSTADSQLLVAASSVTHDLGLGGRSRRSLLARSRVVVVLLSLMAVLSALFGTKEIFSKVLFAWSAMGAAFGPLLLVTTLRGRVSPAGTVGSMLLGFLLSVGANTLRGPELLGELVFMKNWGGVLTGVLPFLVALWVALASVERKETRE